MKLLKKISLLLAATMLSFTMSSCLGNDDSPSTGTTTAQLFATVSNYSSDKVYFETQLPNDNNTYTLVADALQLDRDILPVGSRALITYDVQSNQDLNLPIRISLRAAVKAATADVIDAGSDACKLDYPYIYLNSNSYLAGNYINLLLSVEKSTDRTWTAYIDAAASTGDVAELYLVTTATGTTSERAGAALSVNISTLTSRYSTIKLHMKTQYGDNNVQTYKVKGGGAENNEDE